MATDLCFAFTKFSYATGTRSDNSIPWAHITSSDLFLVTKGTKTTIDDGQLSLRVVQGTAVLESIDISGLIDAANEIKTQLQQANATVQVEQLPIFGMTKNTLLALRYRQRDGQTRRLQFAMQNPSDCQQVVSTLIRRGMEFQSYKPKKARLDTPRPDSAASQTRPLSWNSSSPFFNHQSQMSSQSNPFTVPVVEAGRLSPSRLTSVTSPAKQLPPQCEPATSRPSNDNNMMPPPRVFARDEVTLPRDVSPNRPTTAHMFRPQTMPYPGMQYDQPANLATSGEQALSPLRYQDLNATVQSGPQTSSVLSQHNIEHGYNLPDHAHSSAATSVNPMPHSTDAGNPRPASGRLSAHYTIPAAETLEHEIPPRRELPFERPDSLESTKSKAKARPKTSSLDLPPLPRPTSVKKSPSPTKSISSNSNSVSPVKHTLPAHSATTSNPKPTLSVTQDHPQVAAPTETINTAASKSMSSVPSYLNSHPRRSSPMQELFAKKNLANTARLNSLADAPHEIVTPPGSSSSPTKSSAGVGGEVVEQAETSDNAVTNQTYNAFASTRNEEVTALRDYAAQSDEDRQTAIDDFMIEMLENPDFTKLCEDVENSWRRIALGL